MEYPVLTDTLETANQRFLHSMHGRKKVPIDEAKKIKAQQKAKLLKAEYEKVMSSINNPEMITEVVKSGTFILDTIHDFATLWNMRKTEFLNNPTLEQMEIELKISQRVLTSNPKSYWAFHHRRWIFEYMNVTDLQKEVDLCGMLIDSDSRNFHAWRHRRWAVLRCGNMFDSELEMTQKLISRDFSNYSAWHYRSQLPSLINYEEELDMAKSAIWTDPRDQSAWFYYRWLINRPVISANHSLLQEEASMLEELISEEPSAKYAYLSGIWIQRKLPECDTELISKYKQILNNLDPIRAPYYEEQ